MKSKRDKTKGKVRLLYIYPWLQHIDIRYHSPDTKEHYFCQNHKQHCNSVLGMIQSSNQGSQDTLLDTCHVWWWSAKWRGSVSGLMRTVAPWPSFLLASSRQNWNNKFSIDVKSKLWNSKSSTTSLDQIHLIRILIMLHWNICSNFI